MTRKEILDKAAECVCGKRETDYGLPEESFTAHAQMLTAYLRQARHDLRDALDKTPLTAKDSAMSLALLKCTRIATGNTPDIYVDLAGYAACAGELAVEEKMIPVIMMPNVRHLTVDKCSFIDPLSVILFDEKGGSQR